MRPADNANDIEKLIKKLRYNGSAETHNRILGNIMQALDAVEKEEPSASTQNIWRTIMKSKITKIAAAAVIVIAVVLCIHQFGKPLVTGTPTFAQVIQPIFNAKTATLTIIIGQEGKGPEIHDMIMGSRIRRTLSNIEDLVAIIDLQTGRILQLTPSKKEAIYIDLKDWPSIPNYMDRLRNVITKLQDSPHFMVEELGIQKFNNQKLIGFRAKHPKTEITIWADPKIALPVRIEQIAGQMQFICKDLQFDVPMDESLFSMDVPEGYSLQQAELDLHGATEEDFIEGLRIMAEDLGDGYFPDSVALEDYLKQAPAIMKKCEELGLSEEEQAELGLKLQQYLLFIRFFKGEGEWHYAGKGVRLGDVETPIFWYQPKDSETYRVIYGDLHVEDVDPENLPRK
jgi:hypothetical protein